jgi:phosphohistidine phosphatase SixA
MWRPTRPESGTPIRVLLRHADAGLRSAWSGPDEWRGLTEAGDAQAAAVPARLRSLPILRILSSPSLRCRQTVVPIARELSVDVEPCWQLGPHVELRDLLRLLGDPETNSALLCTHRETLQLLSAHLAEVGWAQDGESISAMPMGAAWILCGTVGTVGSAWLQYLPSSGAVPLLR